MKPENVSRIEQKIGYVFKDKNLLKDANLCDLDNIVNTYVLGREKENEEENTT